MLLEQVQGFEVRVGSGTGKDCFSFWRSILGVGLGKLLLVLMVFLVIVIISSVVSLGSLIRGGDGRRGRFRAGEKGLVHQGLVEFGDDLGARRQEAVLGDELGGGNQAVDRFQFQGHLQFIDLAQNAAAGVRALDDPVDVAFGGGSLDGLLDMIQKAVELEEADLGLAALEALPGLEQPVLQVVFMAPESGTAGAAVLLLEGVKGLAAGQQGQVDGARRWG